MHGCLSASDCCCVGSVSESSMFITRNRFILKTCGKTTLLAAIKPLLELVYDKCGFDIIVVLSVSLYSEFCIVS